MNAQKFTQKSLEALNLAQSISAEMGNPQIDCEHLLVSLLEQENGLISELIKKAELVPDAMAKEARRLVESLPKVSSGAREVGKIYVSSDLDRVLSDAEGRASKMGDEYVSVEHLMLSLIEIGNKSVKELFRVWRLDREKFLSALSSVRKNVRVESDNPEETYDALKKYGTDLVERARTKKPDPIIGRDDEIRNVIRILSRKT
ncbi:MAG: type VI secretion system ATPase TssH, partial [Clostridia bacterium]|nr:type VI secretion system ATPase TssH [Clostridia bacterium]